MRDLDTALLNDKIEEVEMRIELLKGLTDEREDSLSQIIVEHIKVLNRALLYTDLSIEYKEQIFEILSFGADSSAETRAALVGNPILIEIIIGILLNMTDCEKLTREAAMTLSNISTAPDAK